MKRLFFAIALVAVSCLSMSAYATDSQSDSSSKPEAPERQGWEGDIPLYGDVESVDIAIYKLEEKFGEVVRGDIWCSEKYYFNKAGDVIESAYYDSDGSLGWKYIYKYDVSGNMIEWAEYKSDGSSDWKRIYKYDASGNRIERTEYRGEALLPDRQTVYEIIYRK